MARLIVLAEYRTSPARLLALVRRAAAADRGAFTRLYDALEPEISATVGGVVADPVRAEAVTSATFVEAWSGARSHTGPRTDVAAWITDIALRRAQEPECPGRAGHPCDGGSLAGLLVRRSAGRRPGSLP